MLISIIVTFLVVGLLLYIITAFIPMEPHIKQLLIVVVVVLLALWSLQELGLLGALGSVRIR